MAFRLNGYYFLSHSELYRDACRYLTFRSVLTRRTKLLTDPMSFLSRSMSPNSPGTRVIGRTGTGTLRCELCLVKSGAVYVCLSDKKLELKAGEGCFINSGMLHMIAPVEDPDSTYYCIDFLPALLSLFPGSIFEKRYIDP